MAEYDIIIRGGTIVDGLRTPRYIGDLAIKDGRSPRLVDCEELRPTGCWTLRV